MARRIVCLSSIPPRFVGLEPVLDSLCRQGADTVVLCLPRAYRRFPGPVLPPALPDGVTLLRCACDLGPATKLLPALEAFPDARITCCDDDMLYAPGWLDALTGKAARDGQATTGAGWSVARLKRQGAKPPLVDIAQGFSGLSVSAAMFDRTVFDIPAEAWPVDDVWLSGQLAWRGVPIRAVPEARDRVTPLARPDQLQHARISGYDRAAANADCAAWLHSRFGIWPPL